MYHPFKLMALLVTVLVVLVIVTSPTQAETVLPGSAPVCNVLGAVCNKYDPDVDCWDAEREIWFQNGCTEGEEWCDGVETGGPS